MTTEPSLARPLGLSGVLARAFIASKLTPLILLAAFGLGLMALAALPREEEPQISVPMVDIHVRADGLAAADAVELVTRPLEAIVLGIPGVEHVYSSTEDDRAIVTARFLVGTNADDAILRVHEKVRAKSGEFESGPSTRKRAGECGLVSTWLRCCSSVAIVHHDCAKAT